MLGFVDPEADIDPGKPAVLIGDASLSYGDLDRRSAALAHVMVAHGVGVDDPVAVMLPNGFEIIEAGIATAKAGAAFLPVNWHLGRDEVGWILVGLGNPPAHLPRRPGRDRPQGTRARPRLRRSCSSETTRPTATRRCLASAPAGDPDVEARASLSYRFYTSGTTGRPRGRRA